MMFGKRRFGDSSFVARLMISSAVSALAIGSAQAQTPATSGLETVVVTGTSIRGAQPVGQNLITVDRASIEATGAQNVQQLFEDIPQLTGFGGAGQGGNNNSDGAGGFAPAIHNIGGGSSSATLVLIDGHRFPTQGLTEAQSDPTVIPTSALERVEVLPDGASAIYGSDAVAGVLNFITRKDFTGIEFGTQAGIASGYNTFTANGTIGQAWTGGSVLASYDYSSQSDLMFGSRSYMTTRQDIRRGQVSNPALFTGGNTTTAPASGGIAALTVTPASGPGTTVPGGIAIPALSDGVNFQNFSCPVATISPTANATAYYYQPNGGYGGPAVYTATANVPNQGLCDSANVTSILPSVTRNSGIIQFRQELASNLTLDMEAVYGSRTTWARSSRGTIANITAFGSTAGAGAGSSATTIAAAAAGEVNPFYVGNTATGNATEVVHGYDFNALLGPGAGTKELATNAFLTAGLNWDLGNDQEITLSGTAGNNLNSEHVLGTVSAAEANLALNGTTNAAGTPATTAEQDVFGLGTTYPVQRVLNATNALDVWDPAGSTNKTSAQVINSLKSNNTFTNANQGLEDIVGKFDGPVFQLPAGAVKVAVGGEYMHATMDEYGTTVNAAGPTLSNSNAYYYREGRSVYSAFVEANIPVVSPEMNFPLVEKFSLDVSGRYDKYSDVGDTHNPKIAFDWLITDGIKGRGSYGTSFVAPTVHDAQAFNSQSQINGAATPANPIIPFNSMLPFNGGAGIAGTWVSTAPSCAAGHGTPVNAAGATVAATDPSATGCKIALGAANSTTTSAAFTVPGGNNSLKPATGRSWEGGFDIDFGKFINPLDGLTAGVTYWDTNYRGLITNQQTQNNIPQLTTFAPIGGWTPTSPAVQSFIAGRPLTIAMPAQIWATVDGRLQNAFNIWENGIDFNANYVLRTDDIGTFRFGASGEELLRYTTQGGNTGPLLNTLDGANSPRYPSSELNAHLSLGWALDAFSATLGMNYIHPTNTTFSGANFPYNLPGDGRGYNLGSEGQTVYTSAGIVHIHAVQQFNLSTNYVLPKGFWGLPSLVSEGTSVSLIIDNILDTNAPFYPASQNGYTNGNPIGRMVTVGIKKTF